MADYIWNLKAQAGGDVGIHGSIALTRSLLRVGLVDELRLVVAPAIAGRGRRLFDGNDALQKLELGSRSHVDRHAPYRLSLRELGMRFAGEASELRFLFKHLFGDGK